MTFLKPAGMAASIAEVNRVIEQYHILLKERNITVLDVENMSYDETVDFHKEACKRAKTACSGFVIAVA